MIRTVGQLLGTIMHNHEGSKKPKSCLQEISNWEEKRKRKFFLDHIHKRETFIKNKPSMYKGCNVDEYGSRILKFITQEIIQREEFQCKHLLIAL